jgi:hypothetical protein
MGRYANSLSGRLRGLRQQNAGTRPAPDVERLRAVAILRDGVMLERGFKSHWQLRAALNPELPDHTKTIPGDVDGFVTTKDRFVDRWEGQDVAVAAGQLGTMMGRPMLSSDLDW